MTTTRDPNAPQPILMVGRLALAMALLVGCASPTGTGSSPVGSRPPTPGPTPVAPTPVGSVAPGTPAAGWVRLQWQPVVAAILRPHGGFEHRFLVSARGMLIMITNLEGRATTLVASSPDGATWTPTSVDSSTIPAGRELDGAADWLQVVPRSDGRPGLELVASGDGVSWVTRGRLPDTLASVLEAAARDTSILACGSGRGDAERNTICGLSRDLGATWETVDGLVPLVPPGGLIQGIVPVGTGWLATVEGAEEGRANVLTSPDGLDWTLQRDSVVGNPWGPTVIGSTVVVVGMDAGQDGDAGGRTVMSASIDEATWRTVSLPPTQNPVVNLVAAGRAVAALGWLNQPEGSAYVTDILVSADGWTWRLDTVPGPMRTWPDPLFFPLRDGVLAIGPDAMMLGTVVPTDDPGPTPVPG